jgi:hypothetical protein
MSLKHVSFLVGLRTYQHPCKYTRHLIWSPWEDEKQLRQSSQTIRRKAAVLFPQKNWLAASDVSGTRVITKFEINLHNFGCVSSGYASGKPHLTDDCEVWGRTADSTKRN